MNTPVMTAVPVDEEKGLRSDIAWWSLVGLGSLPFVTTVKLPPLANFWGEWIAGLLAISLLMGLNWRAHKLPGVRVNLLPVAVVPFVGLALLMALQHALRLPEMPAAYLLPMGELLIAAALAVAGATLAQYGGLRRSMDALSLGFVIALAINFAGLLIESTGHQIYVVQWVGRPTPARALAFVGQPNQLAVVAMLGWVAAVYRWRTAASSFKTYCALTAMASVIVAASASRAGLVCALVLFVLSLATSEGNKPIPAVELKSRHARAGRWSERKVLWWSAGGFALVQIVWAVGSHLWLNTGPGGAMRGEYSPRLELLRDAWALWRHHPILGVGYGQFSARRWSELSSSMLEANATHSHNLELNLLAEFGLVGTLVALLPLLYIAYRSLRGLKLRAASSELYFASAVGAAILVYSQFEYPLWYTYFLFPLAFALGCLPQPHLKYRASKHIGLVRVGIWSIAAALNLVVLADYLRLQEIFSEVGMQRQEAIAGGNQWLDVSQEAGVIARATFFPLAADSMYARTLAVDGVLLSHKREIARRVMLTNPKAETIARYVSFSLAEGDTKEADRWLIAASTRNVKLFEAAVTVLHVMAYEQPAVKAYLVENGLQ